MMDRDGDFEVGALDGRLLMPPPPAAASAPESSALRNKSGKVTPVMKSYAADAAVEFQ